MKRTAYLAAFVLGALVLGAAIPSPRAQPAAPFFFIQFTDPQFGMAAENAGFGQETANLEFAVATANRLRPSFVIVTGDLVNRAGDPAQAAEYLRVIGKLDPAITVYHVAGNHDVGGEPTPESLAAYTRRFGPDHFSFRQASLAGIVLDSCLVFAPQKAPEAAAAQDRWLRAELNRARRDGARHIVVFQHHPLFVKDAAEPDQYENIPRLRRGPMLRLLGEFGVGHVFAGHYHQNAIARDGALEMVTTGPVGMPLRGARSGMRIAVVSDAGIDHRYYEFGELPNRVALPR